MTIFTIGYEGIDFERFMTVLVEHGIETIVDVRELPLSRKRGFSKTALAAGLNTSGLSYVHMSALGCPKPVRNRYREDRSWKHYTDGFLRHLKTQTEAIAELSKLARDTRCALLCFEADFNFCHRSMVANSVRDFSGADVRHLSAA